MSESSRGSWGGSASKTPRVETRRLIVPVGALPCPLQMLLGEHPAAQRQTASDGAEAGATSDAGAWSGGGVRVTLHTG